MKCAADFRAIARDALRGKWNTAILIGFLASLLGAGIATSSSSSIDSDSITDLLEDTNIPLSVLKLLFIITVLTLIWAVITLIVSGAAKLGYAIFNLKLVDNKHVALSDLFSQFHRLGDGFCMNFLVGLFTLLWTLLFIIPGIIKSYSYSMTPYIFAENPGMKVTDAITKSRQMMNGNKWRLFCLDFSFIGWSLLCALPSLMMSSFFIMSVVRHGNIAALFWLILFYPLSFVGNLFLTPYVEAAHAAFYRDITVPYVPIKSQVVDMDSIWDDDTVNTDGRIQ